MAKNKTCMEISTFEIPNAATIFLFLLGFKTLLSSAYIKRFQTEKRMMSNKAGDLPICRGDLVHGGTSYATPNVRLHYYIDFKTRNRKPSGRVPNTTYTYRPNGCVHEYRYFVAAQIGRENFSRMRDITARRRHHIAAVNAAKKARATIQDTAAAGSETAAAAADEDEETPQDSQEKK